MFERHAQQGQNAISVAESSEASGPVCGPDQVYDLLREVIDPEVGVNIVDLGLVYDVQVAANEVGVRMTLTTPGCPLSGYMDDSIRRTLTRLPGVDRTHVDIVWDPPWSPAMMTDDAKRHLGWLR